MKVSRFDSLRISQVPRAFTLVELMVSVSILVILMLVVSNFIGLVQRTWVRTNSNVSQFREARMAFDILTRNISQATLNTYWQAGTIALSGSGSSTFGATYQGTAFERQSELQFVCGPTVGGQTALFTTGTANDYPGHGVFFQAPLGVTGLVEQTGDDQIADTQNMVNLLCGRGYFVAWGDDVNFRPAFLTTHGVPTRTRFRLMEFSPTAEKNPIYSDPFRLDKSSTGAIPNTMKWFRQATDSTGATTAANLQTTDSQKENAATRDFTRPIAENILALIISPRTAKTGQGANTNTYNIAPNYIYDSTTTGASGLGSAYGVQGTRHLLPPMLHVTMVALDSRGGERLSFDTQVQSDVVKEVTSRFASAASYEADLKALEDALLAKRLAYRVFTTAIPLRQSRWSK